MSNAKKYADLVEMVRETYEKEKAKIEQNDKWTPQAKADQLREISETYNNHLAKLKLQLAAERESRLKTLEQKLFAVGDNPSLQMNYRDAISRAGAVAGSEDQLSNLMHQALETGDKTLAKGVAFTAQKHGYFDLAAQAFDGAYKTYFQEYMSIQSALANPVSRESIEESFMFSPVN
jgi:hypothetical protein